MKNNKYILRQGLNIVDIPSSCTLTIEIPTEEILDPESGKTKIVPVEGADNATLVFSDLTLIKYDAGNEVYKINPYIVNFSLKDRKASVVVEALSEENIFVSSISTILGKKYPCKSFVPTTGIYI